MVSEEYIIAKNYWREDYGHFVINVLKFEKMEWAYLHGIENTEYIPIFEHIDAIYYDTEDERDSKFYNMEKFEGYTVINDFEPPANTHDYTQDVQWNQMRRRN